MSNLNVGDQVIYMRSLPRGNVMEIPAIISKITSRGRFTILSDRGAKYSVAAYSLRPAPGKTGEQT